MLKDSTNDTCLILNYKLNVMSEALNRYIALDALISSKANGDISNGK